jgi:hypothetical protein
MQQPEAYIGRADNFLDEDGRASAAPSQGFLLRFGQAFEAWIRRQSCAQ